MKTNEEFKGTKGEWQLTTTGFIVSDKGGDICRISDHCGYGDIRGSDLANAQLIEAAPNMAHVLQQIWDCYETKGQLLAFNVSLVREVLEQALGNTEKFNP